MACLIVLYLLSGGGSEGSKETFQDCKCPGRDSNRVFPEYKLETLLLEPSCLLTKLRIRALEKNEIVNYVNNWTLHADGTDPHCVHRQVINLL